MNFNCASDTCSLVAAMSVRTSHWYHAGCGMKMKLIMLGFSSKGGDAPTGMHFLHWMSACFRDVWVCEKCICILCKGLGSRDLDERALLCLEDRRDVYQTR